MKRLLRIKIRSAWALLVVSLLVGNVAEASGGWVIERDERPDSPLLKERKAVALTPAQQEQRAITIAYQKALQEEQQRIRQQWPDPEVSSQSRWVTYTHQYATRKVVDFERNQVEISIDGIYAGSRLDFAAMSKAVQAELADTLGTSLQQALDHDPVQQVVNLAIAGVQPKPLETGMELVLKELFVMARPTESDVQAKAAALMRNASIRYQVLSASVAVPVKTGKKLTWVVPLPDNRIRKKAQEYRGWVKGYAERFALAEDVVLALIHTESHFNPLARSHAPAFGLMQIVPTTAGRDAAVKLGREPQTLTAEFLYDPRHNIEVGTAYLSVIYYEYLKDIKDPASRLYCALAAYNAGASSVALAFVDRPSFQDAVQVINQMTAEQVLERLVKAGPNAEVRQYVEKVLMRRKYYASL